MNRRSLLASIIAAPLLPKMALAAPSTPLLDTVASSTGLKMGDVFTIADDPTKWTVTSVATGKIGLKVWDEKGRARSFENQNAYIAGLDA